VQGQSEARKVGNAHAVGDARTRLVARGADSTDRLVGPSPRVMDLLVHQLDLKVQLTNQSDNPIS
jgi:hypothetical protein